MERDHLPRSSCLSGCMISSPSCFPVHDEMEYSRIHSSSGNSSNKRSTRRWRHFIRRLVRDGKSSLYGSSSSPKPLSFHYDAVSYSQNFDEGCHHEDSRPYCPKILRDVRIWDLQE
ncbi:conserved hypothetical protein [Ricinus communis]|uniref:Uncharacterized protein n=1 Tax=Ricinus communis TaxID=3988 RepID=B9SMK8_RICCO|nr:conserved hypothetical protein [Ricinus communis]